MLGLWFRVQVSGLKFWVQGFGLRFWGLSLGFGRWGSVLSVRFSAFCFQRSVPSVWGLGSIVQGAEFETKGLDF